MILWLASYPRSGNTFLRTLLNNCFGLKSYSIYNDKNDIGKSISFADTVGHKTFSDNWDAFYEQAIASSALIPIKTHDAPVDNAKAIYVVRDARATIVSFYHYLLNYSQYKADIYDVISGAVSYGGWRQHYESWAPQSRPNTLFLKFEELTGQPDVAVQNIANFLKFPIKDNITPTFSKLQEKSPKFFRSGSNQRNLAELTKEQLSYLYFLHGDLLKELGYIKHFENDPLSVKKAIDMQAEKLAKFRMGTMAQVTTNLYHVKHIVTNLRSMQESDREYLHRSEFNTRKILKLLGDYNARIEASEQRIRARNRKIRELAKMLETEKNTAARAKAQLQQTKEQLQQDKAQLRMVKANHILLAEKLAEMDYVLAPRFKSLIEMRALRYVLAKRHNAKTKMGGSSEK